MKFTLATIALFAGLAVALPAGNLNANQDAADAKNTNQKANDNANAAANDGSGVSPCVWDVNECFIDY